MNVLQTISSGGIYGAERMVMELSGALERAGCRTLLGVFRNQAKPDPQLSAKAREAGFRVEEIPCRGRLDRRTIAAIRSLAQSFNATIVHSHGYKANVYSWAAFGSRGPRLISTCHFCTNETASLRLCDRLDRFLLRRYHAVSAVSEQERDRLLLAGVSPGKIRVINNGIDCAPFAGATPSMSHSSAGFLVGTVGRLVAQKNPRGFLASARETLKTFPATNFLFIGDGPDRQSLEGLCQEWGIAENVHFVGFRHDMPNVYASLDLFVLPSIAEGLPMAVLEAMSAGIPVIATRVGAVEKVVHDGETGLLLEPQDQGALDRAVQLLLGDRVLALRLARNGQQWVRKYFSGDAMAQNYLGLYRFALSQTGALQ